MFDVLAPLSLTKLVPLCLVGLQIFLLLAELTIGYLFKLEYQLTAQVTRVTSWNVTTRVIFPRWLVSACNLHIAKGLGHGVLFLI